MPPSLATLLTTTTSSLTAFLPSSTTSSLSTTHPADGDTPADTHIARVLRAYYAEQRRPLPDWLPSAAPSAASRPALAAAGYGASARSWIAGATTPAVASQTQQQKPALTTQPSARRAAGLSDLWGPPTQQQQQQQAPSHPPLSSLRRSGDAGGLRPPSGGAAAARQESYLQAPMPSPTPGFVRAQPVGARPLPSQRAGSTQPQMQLQTPGSLRGQRGGAGAAGGEIDYFSAGGGGSGEIQTPGGMQTPGGQGYYNNSSGATTAQERLKARLWGGARGGGETGRGM